MTDRNEPWALPWHDFVRRSAARFKVIVAHRKAKKTLFAIKELDKWAQLIPATYWLVEPTLKQGKRIVWDDPDMFARNVLPEAWARRNKTDYYIAYPNGSKLYLIGAKGEDALRGPNPLGVVLDEYDDMDVSVWPTLQPIFTANPDAWCIFTGTYKGKKDLYAKMQYALEHPGAWFGFTLKASESGIIAAEDLKQAKETTTAAFYDMEYECIPIEGGMSFFSRIRENLWHGDLGPLAGRDFQLGIDLAKVNDWTVITPVDLMERKEWGAKDPFLVGRPDRFNQIDWPFQKLKIMASWALHNRATTNLDGTGIGNVIVDDLRAEKIKPLNAITFTETMRNDLLKHAQILVAQDMVRIPEYEPLIDELESVSYDVTKSGRVYIGVPDGQHDDCVMSFCLALWNAKKRKSARQGSPVFVDTAPTSDNPLGLVKPGYRVQGFKDNTDDIWNGK